MTKMATKKGEQYLKQSWQFNRELKNTENLQCNNNEHNQRSEEEDEE